MLEKAIDSVKDKEGLKFKKIIEGNHKHSDAFYESLNLFKSLSKIILSIAIGGYLIGFSSTGKTNPKEWEDYIKRTKNQAIENAQYRKEVNASYNSIFKDKDSLDVYLGNQELKKYIQLNPVFSFDIKERAVIENRKMSIKDKLNR